MALYSRYLVCYDIENNKTRRKLFNELKDLGLIPIQKSVFWGQLNHAEYRSLIRLAHNMLDPDTDKCFWMNTSLDLQALKHGIGYQYLEVTNADGHKCI